MATERSASLPTGTKLVVGLLALATVLVIISRVYYTPSPEDEALEVLQQQGVPAARQGMSLSREGRKLLPLEEQHELDALYAEALRALTPEEQQRFKTLAQQGAASNDREVAESAELTQRALRALPQDKLQRLWALIEKAVRLQLAQQKPGAAEQKTE
jgi:hypothetical protein